MPRSAGQVRLAARRRGIFGVASRRRRLLLSRPPCAGADPPPDDRRLGGTLARSVHPTTSCCDTAGDSAPRPAAVAVMSRCMYVWRRPATPGQSESAVRVADRKRTGLRRGPQSGRRRWRQAGVAAPAPLPPMGRSTSRRCISAPLASVCVVGRTTPPQGQRRGLETWCGGGGGEGGWRAGSKLALRGEAGGERGPASTGIRLGRRAPAAYRTNADCTPALAAAAVAAVAVAAAAAAAADAAV